MLCHISSRSGSGTVALTVRADAWQGYTACDLSVGLSANGARAQSTHHASLFGLPFHQTFRGFFKLPVFHITLSPTFLKRLPLLKVNVPEEECRMPVFEYTVNKLASLNARFMLINL